MLPLKVVVIERGEKQVRSGALAVCESGRVSPVFGCPDAVL